METTAERPENVGHMRAGLAVLFVAPSGVALFASSALAHHSRFLASGLWFIYEISMYVGCVGAGITALMTIFAVWRHEMSLGLRWFMGILVVVGIFLLWLAGHIYRSPWAPTT